MPLSFILYLTLAAFLISWLLPTRWKVHGLLIASMVFIYWLQPALTIRNLDFWLPSVAITLTLITWFVTQFPGLSGFKSIWLTLTFIFLTIFGLAILRYLDPICCLTASRPPPYSSVLIYLLFVLILAWITSLLSNKNKAIRYALISVIIGLLIVQKTPILSEFTSTLLRKTTGQDINLASALDISWLGFSYLAFRLLHVLQDANSGRIGKISLGNFLIYALFFPSYTAGPIDRMQRFDQDLHLIEASRHPASILEKLFTLVRSENFVIGSKRILIGIFKKFVLADSLAIIAINDLNAMQVQESTWAWVLIYAYSLRIYLDFSGYTDVAIGIGNLLGIKLPENFSQPYQKTNLTTFWNSWHITLSQWFRAYFFNPVTRWFRSHPGKFPVWLIVLIGQTGTMLLIGLWHGISWNFAIWGLWHAVGLFIHNRWSDWSRPIQNRIQQTKTTKLLWSITSWLITFNYVSLGWVWFALSDLDKSLYVLLKIF